MIIYPAIDLRGGKVVQLREGKPDQQTVFGENPLETAKNWLAQGAEWIHMVNLDGAFQEANDNVSILRQVAELDVKVQFGGGLRTLDDVRDVLAAGASRVIMGTMALQNPELVSEAVDEFGADAICIALDAKDGLITTHGWTEVSDKTPVSFGKAMVQR